MQWITVTTPPFGWIEQFDTVRAQLGEIPAGLQARYLGTADGKLRIVTLWESKEHADRYFAERLARRSPGRSAPNSSRSTSHAATSASRSQPGARNRPQTHSRPTWHHQGRARGAPHEPTRPDFE